MSGRRSNCRKRGEWNGRGIGATSGALQTTVTISGSAVGLGNRRLKDDGRALYVWKERGLYIVWAGHQRAQLRHFAFAFHHQNTGFPNNYVQPKSPSLSASPSLSIHATPALLYPTELERQSARLHRYPECWLAVSRADTKCRGQPRGTGPGAAVVIVRARVIRGAQGENSDEPRARRRVWRTVEGAGGGVAEG